jgi:hypothetical protein
LPLYHYALMFHYFTKNNSIMAKSKHNSKIFSGLVFKTAESNDISSRRHSDDYSNRVRSSRYLNPSDVTNKTNNSILSLLKSRKNQTESEKLTPNTISTVVKNYILPMFTYDLQKQRKNKRKQEYAAKQCSFDSGSATVYAELKLSDQLRAENESLLEKLTEKEEQLVSFAMRKESAETELELFKAENFSLQTLVRQLIFTNQSLIKKTQNADLRFNFMQSKNQNYKELYQLTEKRCEELTKSLQEQREINDIRFNL